MTSKTHNDSGSNNTRTVKVESPNVQYSKEYIESTVDYPINYAVDKDNAMVVNLQMFII